MTNTKKKATKRKPTKKASDGNLLIQRARRKISRAKARAKADGSYTPDLFKAAELFVAALAEEIDNPSPRPPRSRPKSTVQPDAEPSDFESMPFPFGSIKNP